jgi:hypothetical protein
MFGNHRNDNNRVVPDASDRMHVVPLHASQHTGNKNEEQEKWKRREGASLFPAVQWLPGAKTGRESDMGPSKLSAYAIRTIEEIPVLDRSHTAKLVPERTLFCLAPTNSVREVARVLEQSRSLFYLVYASIVGSSFFILITPPADDLPEYEYHIDLEIVAIINTVFVAVFSFEFVVRVMSRGLYFTQDAYLKDGWNKMDFVILVISWIDESGKLGGVREGFFASNSSISGSERKSGAERWLC